MLVLYQLNPRERKLMLATPISIMLIRPRFQGVELIHSLNPAAAVLDFKKRGDDVHSLGLVLVSEVDGMLLLAGGVDGLTGLYYPSLRCRLPLVAEWVYQVLEHMGWERAFTVDEIKRVRKLGVILREDGTLQSLYS